MEEEHSSNKRPGTPSKTQGSSKTKLFKSDFVTSRVREMESSNRSSSGKLAESEASGDEMSADTAGVACQVKSLVQGFRDFEVRMECMMKKSLDHLTEVVNDVKLSLISHEKECEEKIVKLEKELEQVHIKLDDLENRSRRNNLIFFGIPEGDEKGQPMISYMEKLLQKYDPALKPDIQRAHRTPTGPPPERSRTPRPVHVAFASYPMKEAVKKLCIGNFKKITDKKKKMFVDDDLSHRVRAQRKKLLPALQNLRKAEKKAFFVYPAQIKYYEGDRLVTWKEIKAK